MSIYQADPRYRYRYQKRKNFNDEARGYSIYIPRAHAREESNIVPDDPSKVDHYELYLDKQIGSSLTKRPTNVYWKLPKSGKYIVIELYRDDSINFRANSDDHKYAIRETDELDRRIVLGFCKKYKYDLISICHRDYDEERDFDLDYRAKMYTASMMPKRIKLGNNNILPFLYKGILEPYEESNFGIFNNLQFI